MYPFNQLLQDRETKLLAVTVMLIESQTWGVPQFKGYLQRLQKEAIYKECGTAGKYDRRDKSSGSATSEFSSSSLQELPQVAITAQKFWGSAPRKQSK